MAIITIGVDDFNCLPCCINSLSNIIIMVYFQGFMVLIAGFFSLRYVIKSLFYRSKNDKDCGPDCGCH
jgi:hypothetical protein